MRTASNSATSSINPHIQCSTNTPTCLKLRPLNHRDRLSRPEVLVRRRVVKLFGAVGMLLLASCASYTTPGGSANISALATPDVATLLAVKPVATAPARVAVAQLQQAGYRNYQQQGYGQGAFSLVMERDAAADKALQKLARLDGVAAVAPINRLLLPTQLDSIAALRQAAARVQANLLLVYTFDTRFQTGQQQLPLLNTILLGTLNNQPLTVKSNVSAVLFDVQTEYVYGVTEANVQTHGRSSIWQTDSEVDTLRQQAEQQALANLMEQFQQQWPQIQSQLRHLPYAPHR